jgi:cyanophycin synthetase
MTSQTSYIAVELAADKFLSTRMLQDAGIPVPETIETDNAEQAYRFFKNLKAPLVAKPVKGKLGEYSSVNIRTKKQIKNALQLAAASGEKVLVQRFVPGNVYRLLVINNKFVVAARLEPPSVTGDGQSTVLQLIEQLNTRDGREWGDKGKLSKVETDDITIRILEAEGLGLNSVLPTGKKLFLKKSGNPKVGGYSTDVTANVHFMNRFFAEYAAQIVGLDIAGVDIICNDISKPIRQNSGAVIEINAAPDFRMHLKPARGEGHNVAAPLLDMLFPAGQSVGIPVFSVTGSSGKTLTTQLLNFCFRQAGYRTGLANSEGLTLNGKNIFSGDATFPRFVATILKNPNLDCAVVETSKEGILREGLGYQYAGFGIVLNVEESDTGSDDIRYIEDLAYAMSVVAEQVYDDGFTILNADDEHVLEMRQRIYSRLALFSLQARNPEVTAHTRRGGLAVYTENNSIVLHHFNTKTTLMPLDNISPALRETQTQLQALMATITALHAFGFESVKIKTWIKSFKPERK